MERIRLQASINMVDSPSLLSPCIIRVENADQEQGIFLVSATTPAVATRVAVYSRMGSNIVDGKIPVLDAGDYWLECRTRPTAKDIRTGSYDGIITIS